MKNFSLVGVLGVVALSSIPAAGLAKPVYLSCPTADPKWPPPLVITLDEDRGDATVSNRNSSGSSPNPVFTADSVEFGYDGTIFTINRVNLLLVTGEYGENYRTMCKLSQPRKRAF